MRLLLLSVSLALLVCQLAVVPAAQAAGMYSMRAALTGSHLAISPTLVNETLNPGDPPVSTSAVTLTNSGAASSSWAITSTLPSWLAVSPTSGTLASGSSTSFTLTFTAPSATMQTLTTTLVITDPNADNSPISLPVTLSIGQYSRTWYFAEGYTGGSFTEYLTLANPNPDTANVAVQYLLQGGQLPLDQTYSILSNARYTIDVNQAVGPGQNVAIAITSDQPIVAERPMYFTYGGIAGVSVPGGTDTLGATSLGTQFAFAYLDTTANHDTYLTVLNQNSVAIQALVQYYPSGGGTPTNRPHTILARSRATIKVNNEGLGQGTFSAVVTLSATSPNTATPALGLVERPMYLVDGQTGYTGSADVIGLPGGATTWDFAEGFTSPTFSERYILANALSGSATRATVTFYRTDGTSASQTVALQPGQQQVVDANSVLGSSEVSNSAVVTADLPILAERFMSFVYTGPVGSGSSSSIPGATDVLGVQQPSDLYDFAEGYTGGQFGEYLTVENPNPASVNLTVTFLPASGGTPTVTSYTVGATSRFTLLTNSVMPSQSFSMLVQASAPIVAERPMYFIYAGSQSGGSDVIGYAPHTATPFDQGYCFSGCIRLTTGSLSGGGFDETTGLQQWTNPLDAPMLANPMPDPSNGATTLVAVANANSPNTCVSGEGLAAIQPGAELWRFDPPNVSIDGTGSCGGLSLFVGGGGGRVFFGSENPYQTNSMDTIYALDSSLGVTDWTYSLSAGAYLAMVPVDSNGVVYVGDSNGTLYALNDATGAVNWIASIGLPAYGAYYTPTIANNLIYVRGNNATTSQDIIEALNVSNGTVAWSFPVPQYGATLDLVGAQVFADDGNGTIYALNAITGAQQWSFSSGAYYGSGILMAGNGLVMTETTPDGTSQVVTALSAASGAELWSYPLSAGYVATQVVVTSQYDPSGPAVYFGVGVLSNTPTPMVIYSLNATSGTLNWTFQTAEPWQSTPYATLPELAVGNGVYFADYTGTAVFVYDIALNGGTQVWKDEVDTPNGAFTSSGGMSVDYQIGVSGHVQKAAVASRTRRHGVAK